VATMRSTGGSCCGVRRGSGPGGEHVAGVVPLVAGGRLVFCMSAALGEERGSGQWHQSQRPYAGLGLDRSTDELPPTRRSVALKLSCPLSRVRVLSAQRCDFAAGRWSIDRGDPMASS